VRGVNVVTAFRTSKRNGDQWLNSHWRHFNCLQKKILSQQEEDSSVVRRKRQPSQLRTDKAFIIDGNAMTKKKHEFHHSRQMLSHGYAVQNAVQWRIWIVPACITSLLLTFIITSSKVNQCDIIAELSQFVIKQGSFY
jgi:hypothetical protein